jgi:molecular chaperone HtpG
VLDLLAKLADNTPDDYQRFWDEFGDVLKEGPAEDPASKDTIAALFRFASTASEREAQNVSFEDYLSRMKEGQDRIYYICADSYEMAARSPQLEIFRKRGIEVLLLYHRIDDWAMSRLGSYKDKLLQDVMRGDLALPGGDEVSAQDAENDGTTKKLAERLKQALGDRVASVRKSSRLTDSPACLVLGEYDIGVQMRRLLEASGQPVPESRPHFEFNPAHPLIRRLNDEADPKRFDALAVLLLDQAQLADGGQLKDPATYVSRLNELLLELMDGP